MLHTFAIATQMFKYKNIDCKLDIQSEKAFLNQDKRGKGNNQQINLNFIRLKCQNVKTHVYL